MSVMFRVGNMIHKKTEKRMDDVRKYIKILKIIR